ncbi:MAG: Crp/Fnr family transcriptional regulator [Alphaproteobacteria bacterium]|nr:MAG: Crp/Fnr family transcriptional regulator [Alphaproteobacteria bacterium]
MQNMTKFSCFSDLTPAQQQQVANLSSLKHFTSGQEIIGFGDETAHMYFVGEGQVKLYRADENGQDAVLRVVPKGDWFFELSAFFPLNAPAAAVTLRDTDIFMIPSDTMRDIMCHNEAFAQKILGHAAEHFHALTNKVMDMTLKTPLQRVSYFLLQEFIRNGGKSKEFTLPYKKSLIASELGMTAETFSRVLMRLKETGIEIERNKVTLPHAKALCGVCDPALMHRCPHFDPEQCPAQEACLSATCQKTGVS